MKKLLNFWFVSCVLICVVLFGQKAYPAEKTGKNILLLNSYHQGYTWTDSITGGVLRAARSHSDITLYVKYLNSKKFGQTKFELEKKYIQEKYAGITFQGIIVSDNDALDFVIRYRDELFPDASVVFTGISNPLDYPLEKLGFYGFEENINFEGNVELVRELLPQTKAILVITDNTTTGNILHQKMDEIQKSIKDFTIEYPKIIDPDVICTMSADPKYDAILYFTVSQDKDGESINNQELFSRVRNVSKVPVFYDDITFLGKGCIGGMYNNGAVHGASAFELLLAMMGKADRSAFKHINSCGHQYFFDQKELDRFNISAKLLPPGSYLVNKKELMSEAHYFALIGVLVFLVLIVIGLTVINRRQKVLQKRSDKHLELIETQKNELQEAYKKLSNVILELEDSNLRLNKSNVDLQEAKKKAEESDKLKSAFLANVSHEIRTPLNSIVGFSSLLVDEDLDEETRKSYIDLIESNTESLLVLIDEIIDLSKIEAQQLSLKKQNFSVDSLITELYQIFTLNQKNHQVQLQINIADQDKELFAFSDRVRVKQIFINLLSNAFKFTDFGIIEFGYFLSDTQEVILFVKDTGIGIKEEHHQAVFQRFRKLNEAQDKRIYRGTGLGLAITQKLVELLGGKIWIESQFGVGSAFYFTLQDLTLKQKES